MAADLVINVAADVQKALKDLTEVQKSVKGIATQIRNIQLITLGVRAAGAVIRSISSSIRNLAGSASSWIQAYEESVLSQIRLASAIKASGLAVRTTSAEFQHFNDQVQSTVAAGSGSVESLRVSIDDTGVSISGILAQFRELEDQLKLTTNFDDTAIRNATTTFVSMGKSVEEVNTLVRLSADLATGLGVDMSTAAEVIAFSLLRPERAIRRLIQAGVMLTQQEAQILDQAIKSGDQLRFQATLIDILQNRYQGLAQRLALPTRMVQNSWDEVRESLGKFVGILYATFGRMIIPVLQGFADSLSDSNDLMKGLIEIVARVVGGFQTFVKFAVYAGQALLSVMKTGLGFWSGLWRLLGYTTSEAAKQLQLVDQLSQSLSQLQAAIAQSDWAAEFRKNAEQVYQQFENLEDVPGNVSVNLSQSFSDATEEVLDDIERIRRELETVGLTEIERRLYELREKGATEEQLGEARRMLEQIEQINRQREEREEKMREAQRIREQLMTEDERIQHEIETARQLLKEGLLSPQEYLRFLEKQKQALIPHEEPTTQYAEAVSRGTGAFSAILAAMESYRRSRETPEVQTARNTGRLVTLIERLIQEQQEANRETIEL